MDIISDSKHKARKDYTCDYCRCEIKKGDTYSRCRIVDDVFYTWKSHEKCDSLIRKYVNHFDGDDGIGHSEFSDGLDSILSENYTSEEIDELYENHNIIDIVKMLV